MTLNKVMQNNYNFQNYNFPKKPELNGGLYTGKEFNGPWRNYPVIPDEIYMNNKNLVSANPPPLATTQFGNHFRPGNNTMNIKNMYHGISKQHNILCFGNKKEEHKYVSNNPYESKFVKY
jgi:hypothetical protein